jgi:hypothetical protein
MSTRARAVDGAIGDVVRGAVTAEGTSAVDPPGGLAGLLSGTAVGYGPAVPA